VDTEREGKQNLNFEAMVKDLEWRDQAANQLFAELQSEGLNQLSAEEIAKNEYLNPNPQT